MLGLQGQRGPLAEPHDKKIPNHIRSRCEWGRDDYSLNVENLPKALPTPDPEAASLQKATNQADLFGTKTGGSR